MTSKRLIQLQGGILGALVVIWWLTRPLDEQAISTSKSDPAMVADQVIQAPAWIADIDTSKPECRQLVEELLQRHANGELSDIIYLGECDKRGPARAIGE